MNIAKMCSSLLYGMPWLSVPQARSWNLNSLAGYIAFINPL